MKNDYPIVILGMEALMSGFPEPARSANSRGGLGILIGDQVRGFARLGVKADFIVPFHSCHTRPEEKICYDFLNPRVSSLDVPVNGNQPLPVSVLDIEEGSVRIHGLVSPTFDFLYTLDRWQRFQQEVVFGKAVKLLLNNLGINSGIVMANESHTAVAVSEIKADPDLKATRVVFGIHTKHPAGLETFPGHWFEKSGINEAHHSEFFRDGLIDFAKGAASLSDSIIAVSDEFAQLVRKMFPLQAHKVVGSRNGSDRDVWLSPKLKQVEGARRNISPLNLWTIHQANKKELIGFVKQKVGLEFRMTEPLIGLVRRITDFKNQYPILGPIIRAICAERGELVQTALGSLPGLGMQMFCAGVAAAEDYRSWTEAFQHWTKDPDFRGRFGFLEKYDFELLKMTGFDLWFHCPWPGWEACGTSSQRHYINGEPALTTRTGGDMEFVREFDPETGQGNGFYIDPYDSMTVYRKLKIYSDIYYAWLEYGIPTLLVLNKNAYKTGKTLDITDMLKRYQKKAFAPLIGGGS